MNSLINASGLLAGVFLCLLGTAVRASDSTNDSESVIPDGLQLEAESAVIGKISFRILDIFNTDLPEENRLLYRWANRLHIRTHRSVIEDQLLFRSGDSYSEQAVAESERILRKNKYIQDAHIFPVAYHDGVVDLEVTTRDVWTLHPGVSFGRKGGENSSNFEIEDTNFLGRGVRLSLTRHNTVDRTERFIHYTDEQLFGSWWRLNGKYANNSDGYEKILDLDRPFYSLNTRNAGGLNALDNLFTYSLYNFGKITDQFQQQHKRVNLYEGWSASGLLNNRVSRWTTGLTYDENTFATLPDTLDPAVVPEDRKLVYPWIAYETIENDYHKIRNHDQIGRIEDFYFGTHVYASAGYAATGYGSNRNAWVFSALAENGISDQDDKHALLLHAEVSGRHERGEFTNTVISPKISYYWAQTDSWLLYMNLQGDYARRLDKDNPLLLGGENGLRGYPLRYQSGDRRFLFTLEQRLYSSWYPLRLVRVGGAIFFDAGRAWSSERSTSLTDTTGDDGVLRDIGFGLRFGNTRSGRGSVIHIDVAFPLDGDASIDSVQFSVDTKASF